MVTFQSLPLVAPICSSSADSAIILSSEKNIPIARMQILLLTFNFFLQNCWWLFSSWLGQCLLSSHVSSSLSPGAPCLMLLQFQGRRCTTHHQSKLAPSWVSYTWTAIDTMDALLYWHLYLLRQGSTSEDRLNFQNEDRVSNYMAYLLSSDLSPSLLKTQKTKRQRRIKTERDNKTWGNTWYTVLPCISKTKEIKKCIKMYKSTKMWLFFLYASKAKQRYLCHVRQTGYCLTCLTIFLYVL